MIISRTPFRISFAGGGSDLRSFYKDNDGQVISTSINKYIYVVVKRQCGIVEHKFRINWSKVEFADQIDEIEHPIVREALRLLNINFPIEITTFSDVPGQTGLGSSSSFAVGLLHALYALKGQMVTKGQLAKEAAYIEIDVLKRVMGKQDHYAASYGDLNVIKFLSDERVFVEPVPYSFETINSIQNNLFLFYLKGKRDASEILKKQDKNSHNNKASLEKMVEMVYPTAEIFSGKRCTEDLGGFLHKNWLLKRSFSDITTTGEIDLVYEKALKAGAKGGKILGAGGGGFLLLYVPFNSQSNVKQQLSKYIELPFKFDTAGTRITYYDSN